jgi:sporulation protein YlmC with PRC-barrel domain
MSEQERSSIKTVAALFDDRIDAEHALGALRKAVRAAANVSVLARDHAVGDAGEGAVDVTKAVMDTALSTVSNWLSGLAALMVPQRGSFLAAGPIGIALARDLPISGGESSADRAPAYARQRVDSLAVALELFGFRPEEAHYIEERLAAGSAMVAVTTEDADQIDASLQTFADFNAVFVGQAQTPAAVLDETEQWLANPLATKSSEIVVADVVAAMTHVCGDKDSHPALAWLCGLDVYDRDGDHVGQIDDLLADAGDRSLLRYAIVGHGGVLGLARRRVAIPAAVITPRLTPPIPPSAGRTSRRCSPTSTSPPTGAPTEQT